MTKVSIEEMFDILQKCMVALDERSQKQQEEINELKKEVGQLRINEHIHLR